jgi:hypothetical protein
MAKRGVYRTKDYWTDEQLRIEAAPFTRRIDFKKHNNKAYNIARKRGKVYMDALCLHMDPPMTARYTDEELRTVALLCTSRGEFCEKHQNEYQAAHKRGKEFLDSISDHMPPLVHSAYTDEELVTIALLYDREVDFKNGHSGAYSASYNRGSEFLKKICSHMKKGTSKPEETIIEAIKNYFPSAKKFLATKLNIPGKEYIKKLEVDVLVEELGKAIEYDGTYHHSYEGLKRGHPTWRDEDIRNYHQIKDDAFKAIGIDIFRITQDEWKKDPEACIKRCLDFLRNSEQKVA